MAKNGDVQAVEPTIELRPKMTKEEPKEMKKEKTLYDLPGVGAATAEKLEAAGFVDLISIAVATPGELVEVAGVTDAAARKMIQGARSMLDMGFESGEDVLKRREQVLHITTGVKAFDEMLAGGLESGCITECYGAYGSSKTQLAHVLAVNIQLPHNKGGADGVAVYIDTEGTFRPERIIEIAKGSGLDPNKVLKNIKVARAFNSDHQMLLAERVEDLIKKQGLNVKAVIVDSLTAHFRAEFIGRGTLADRQQKLNKHMHVLAKLATLNNLVVYVTNQVMARPDVFFGDPTESIGGHIVAHNSTFRMYLRRGKKNTRVAKLVDSPNLPDSECGFVITTDGLRDI
ncbi:DNA repair and recombination protein RadA [Candidatus Woesearchaeota archaeon]|nr:MAG: DNA repair protein RadA [archaeon GW2011_AR4]MBS3130361.1 DNA repair and recombination protein RadA [Candidatus Woesearchaeota archaeon]HIH38226.1 DNA repair and recombination protein RadA [Candidatus Woesearchaeota archaeon]HIJ04188.1 DNA repair and recombination protein RadA [Candidatus Woesearchaeota archaeon]